MKDFIYIYPVIKQSISLYEKGMRREIHRKIVYSITEDKKNILDYTIKSLPKIDSIVFSSLETSLCFLKKSSKKIFNNGTVDKFWIDGEEYLIAYQIENNTNYLNIIIDKCLKKDYVIKILKGTLVSNEITNIDFISDCWIKK